MKSKILAHAIELMVEFCPLSFGAFALKRKEQETIFNEDGTLIRLIALIYLIFVQPFRLDGKAIRHVGKHWIG